MVGKDFSNEDLVWAKMKGYPHWPAIVTVPTVEPLTKKMQHFVRFFGTGDHAWVHDDLILPHSQDMLNKGLAKKSNASYQNAIKDMQKHIDSAGNKDSTPVDGEKESPPSPVKSSPVEPKVVKPVKSAPAKKKIVKKVVKRSSEVKTEPAEDEEYTQLIANLPKKRASEELVYSSKKVKESKLDFNLDLQSNNDSYTRAKTIEPIAPILPASSALSRSEYIDRPPTPELDIGAKDETWLNRMNEGGKEIKPSTKKIGFLGLGTMGREIVKNLMNSGHNLTLWNRSPEKCTEFEKAGATVATTPCDVVAACDITFCCVSDQDVVKSLVLGNWGVLRGMEGTPMGSKGYVELTSIHPSVSRELAEAITDKGGRYLEAPIHGDRKMAVEGSLIVLGAGDRELFNDCESCFFAMARDAYYLTCTVGDGAKLNIISNMLLANTYAAIAESITLAQSCNLSIDNFMNIMKISPFHTERIVDKGNRMVHQDFGMDTALKHVQKDLHLALQIANANEQPVLVTSASNEVFKKARRRGYSEHDVSSVYMGVKD